MPPIRLITKPAAAPAPSLAGPAPADGPVGTPPASADPAAVYEGAARKPQVATAEDVLPAIRATVAASVESLRQNIRGLETEIGQLEAQAKAKSAEAATLVGQIERRKVELEAAREQKRKIGMLGILLGVPAVGVVSLVQMLNDDDRLRALDASLAGARKDQTTIQQKMAAYGVTKGRLEQRLAELRRSEADLDGTLEIAPKVVPAERAPLAASMMRLEQHEHLVTNLRAQVSLLEKIRDEAAGLDASLTPLIGKLRARLDEAQKAVAASEKELVDLVRISASGDPQAEAWAWLDNALAAKTKKLLSELGFDLERWANALARETLPNDPVGAQILAQGLLADLRGARRD